MFNREDKEEGVGDEYHAEQDEIRRARERKEAEERKRAEIKVVESIVYGTGGRRTTEGEAG